MTSSPAIFDLVLLARHRTRAAPAACDNEFLLAHAADELIDRLTLVQRRFQSAIDVGAHNGLLARRLLATGIPSVTSLEPVAALRSQCPLPSTSASLESLSLADAGFDLAVSALALHLVNDLPGALIQIRRALKPDGLLLAALLGGATLTELRQAWLAAEIEIAGGASPRVAPFADVRDLGTLVQRAGFALPVVDSDTLTVTYADPLALMRELKAMGASNMLHERRRVPVTRGLLLRAAEIYAERFALPNGRIPATFEVLTITAWAPDPSQPKPLQPGSAQISLKDVLKPRG